MFFQFIGIFSVSCTLHAPRRSLIAEFGTPHSSTRLCAVTVAQLSSTKRLGRALHLAPQHARTMPPPRRLRLVAHPFQRTPAHVPDLVDVPTEAAPGGVLSHRWVAPQERVLDRMRAELHLAWRVLVGEFVLHALCFVFYMCFLCV